MMEEPVGIQDVVIACAADDRFIRPLAVMLQSALNQMGPDRSPVVYILHDGIGEADQNRVVSRWERRA